MLTWKMTYMWYLVMMEEATINFVKSRIKQTVYFEKMGDLLVMTVERRFITKDPNVYLVESITIPDKGGRIAVSLLTVQKIS